MKPASSSRTLWALLAVLALSFCLNLFPLWWGLPAWNAWAFDEITPSRVLRGMETRFSGGWSGPYPPLHFYLLSALFWPFVWAKRAGLLELSQHEMIFLLYVVGRSFSVLLATATIYIVYRCARLLGDRSTAVLTALIASLIIPLPYYAKTINLEVPYLFWFVLSVFFLLRALDHHRLRDYLALAVTATCAVCTKDQAYAFYVLVPFFLWIDLHRHRQKDPADRASVWKTLVDRRLVLSGLVAVGFFVLIQNLAFNLDGFKRHLWLVTHRSPSLFTLYQPTLVGYTALTLQSLRHLAFSMTLPLLLASGWGVVAAVLRPRRKTLLLVLLGLALSYTLFFILPVRHNYVRFLMPIAVLLSFFGARAFMRLARGGLLPRPATMMVVAGAFVYAFLRALSVDLLMHFDSRYRVEEWLAETKQEGDLTVGVGRQNMLPRGIDNVPWGRVRRRGFEYFDDRGVDRIVISTDDVKGTRQWRFHNALANGSLGYALELRHRGEPPLNLLDTSGIYTNLDKINPEIEVYRRRGSHPGTKSPEDPQPAGSGQGREE